MLLKRRHLFRQNIRHCEMLLQPGAKKTRKEGVLFVPRLGPTRKAGCFSFAVYRSNPEPPGNTRSKP
jgi:hypothetical protein